MGDVSGHSAVRAMKRPGLFEPEAHQKHELFPTPPWATRALFEHVLPVVDWAEFLSTHILWDPCAGLGHMSEVLSEYSSSVYATDIVLYELEGGGKTSEFGIQQFDFLDHEERRFKVDWIITNPPFANAELFLEPALKHAKCGVAFFERLQWLETIGRYDRVFMRRPPLIALFAERVPLCEGGYDPAGSTASAYAWFVWPKNSNGALNGPLGPKDTLQTFLIPPGRAKALFKPSDLELAKRCVPGWIPSWKKKKLAKGRTASARLERFSPEGKQEKCERREV